MKCPKCRWPVKSWFRLVLARKPDNSPIYIRLCISQCVNYKCNWQYKEQYMDKVRSFGFKPYNYAYDIQTHQKDLVTSP